MLWSQLVVCLCPSSEGEALGTDEVGMQWFVDDEDWLGYSPSAKAEDKNNKLAPSDPYYCFLFKNSVRDSCALSSDDRNFRFVRPCPTLSACRRYCSKTGTYPKVGPSVSCDPTGGFLFQQ